MLISWGWWTDGVKPDAWDFPGVAFCLLGVGVIMYAPRQNAIWN
jgi:small multidrug resistance family-3 protein